MEGQPSAIKPNVTKSNLVGANVNIKQVIVTQLKVSHGTKKAQLCVKYEAMLPRLVFGLTLK